MGKAGSRGSNDISRCLSLISWLLLFRVVFFPPQAGILSFVAKKKKKADGISRLTWSLVLKIL